jgi:hypothetical protein
MLYKETVSPTTLGILKSLMKDEKLNDFILVGGTALSLIIGHRISIDLDLFSKRGFDQFVLQEHLQNKYKFKADYIDRNTLKGNASGVALDFITHNYENVGEIAIIEGVRLASLQDIAAMKLNAIINNGTRLKDFLDIVFLGEKIPFNEMVRAYEDKYKTSAVMAAKAVLYHNDIDHTIDINLVRQKYNFNDMVKALEMLVASPAKTHPLISSKSNHDR